MATDSPNGMPYVDVDGTELGAWESGEFRFRLAREDGEALSANFTPTQLRALAAAIEDTRHRAHESDEVALTAQTDE